MIIIGNMEKEEKQLTPEEIYFGKVKNFGALGYKAERMATILGVSVEEVNSQMLDADSLFFKKYETGRYEGEYLVHLKLFEMARAGDIKAIDKLSVIRKQFDKEK